MLARIKVLDMFKAQLQASRFTYMADYEPLRTFTYRTQASGTQRRRQKFLTRCNKTKNYSVRHQKYIADHVPTNEIRMYISTEQQQFIVQRIDNRTLR